MQTNNINKEIQQIQNNIGIIISYFFIRKNQTLVPKIDPEYVNNQISTLLDKMSKINLNFINEISNNQSSFSQKHIESLNRSISNIHLQYSEINNSKYIDENKIKEIEGIIQKQKMQIRGLGALFQKYMNTSIQINPQTNINNFIIPNNEVLKLNAQIRAIEKKMSLFKNDFKNNDNVLDRKKVVNKSLKIFSEEYGKLLKLINSININLITQIDSLLKVVNNLNIKTNLKIDNINKIITKIIENLNNKIDKVNSALTQIINQKESILNRSITAINYNLQNLSDHIKTNIDIVYDISNQKSGRTVYFDKVKVNEIEFASVTNISDITSLSIALGNLTTNFNLIYQNTNINSDKTAYFNKVVAENIECNNFTGISDERLKKNIVDLKNVRNDLEKLRAVGFDWKSNNEADIGFIAQDVEKIFPSLVKTGKDGFKSVKYVNFIPILVQGYREQADELRKLKKILIIGLVVFFFFFMYKCI
jgi:hypothetical protein